MFTTHIAPQLGDAEVRQIRTPAVRKFIQALSRQGLKPKTVALIRTVLRQILEQAVEDDLLEYNPCDRAEGPKTDKATGKAMTLDQGAALLDVAQSERLGLALRLLYVFGLRRGEVCGLRWQDVDLERGTLTIRGTLGYVPGYGMLYGETKSDEIRVFRLPASLVAAFRWHQTRQEAERKAMGWKTPENPADDYVFIGALSGRGMHSGQIYNVFLRTEYGCRGCLRLLAGLDKRACGQGFHDRNQPLQREAVEGRADAPQNLHSSIVRIGRRRVVVSGEEKPAF